jgi:hypothetical protein
MFVCILAVITLENIVLLFLGFSFSLFFRDICPIFHLYRIFLSVFLPFKIMIALGNGMMSLRSIEIIVWNYFNNVPTLLLGTSICLADLILFT